MDALTILGLLLAAFAIFGGQFLEGGSIYALLNLPAFIIVVGGTLGAVMVQTRISVFSRALKMLAWVLKKPQVVSEENIEQITEWSTIARRQGLLGLEEIVEQEADPFKKKGLMMLIDGNEPEVIRSTLIVDLEVGEHHWLQSAKVFESMGGYSPTLGIVGAVIGLIQVMENLSEPSLLGAGIAAAFVATIYGVGFANLLFLPVYNKLKSQIVITSQAKELFIEGLVSIAEGENPRVISNKLSGFLST